MKSLNAVCLLALISFTCYSRAEVDDSQRLSIRETTAIACEGHTLHLSCSSDKIHVWSANYGRTATDVCKYSSVTNCRSSKSLPIVSSLCDGKSSCNVAASNSVFDDPCLGTTKYLEAYYRCTEGYTAQACEGYSTSLSCNSGKVIIVKSANYGRTDSHICQYSSNTKCIGSNSLSVVSGICNGRSSCRVSASNSVFGDPCWGTKKYLTVFYICSTAKALDMGDGLSPELEDKAGAANETISWIEPEEVVQVQEEPEINDPEEAVQPIKEE